MSKGNSNLFTKRIILMHFMCLSICFQDKFIRGTIPLMVHLFEPKSFEIDVPVTKDTPDGKLWTHGNSTEHMYEAITSAKDYPNLKNSNPHLYTQFILYEYYKSVGKAVNTGINYDKIITIGNWEFIIAKPRAGYKYPVVKHANFIGLK